MIARVVRAFWEGGVGRVLVVCAPESEPGAARIAEIARNLGAEVLSAPKPTPDMRSTVEFGLQRLRGPVPPDLVLISPADAPGLSKEAVATLIEAAKHHPGRIVVPVVEGRRGHPLGLPWRFASEIFGLPANLGVNALLGQHERETEEISMSDRSLLEDIDTPEDYQRWNAC